MAEHTPTPWRSMHQYLMTANGPLPIASGYHDYVTTPTGTMHQEAVANAEFICKAVNNHDALVKALQDIAAIENQEFGPDWEEIDQARKIANEALTAAGVGGTRE